MCAGRFHPRPSPQSDRDALAARLIRAWSADLAQPAPRAVIMRGRNPRHQGSGSSWPSWEWPRPHRPPPPSATAGTGSVCHPGLRPGPRTVISSASAPCRSGSTGPWSVLPRGGSSSPVTIFTTDSSPLNRNRDRRALFGWPRGLPGAFAASRLASSKKAYWLRAPGSGWPSSSTRRAARSPPAWPRELSAKTSHHRRLAGGKKGLVCRPGHGLLATGRA